jgi:hypothetical protein
LVSDDDQLRTVARAQFRHRVADMGARGGRADKQLDIDLVVVQALSHQGQHFALALGIETSVRLPPPCGHFRRAPLDERPKIVNTPET